MSASSVNTPLVVVKVALSMVMPPSALIVMLVADVMDRSISTVPVMSPAPPAKNWAPLAMAAAALATVTFTALSILMSPLPVDNVFKLAPSVTVSVAAASSLASALMSMPPAAVV